MAEVVRSIHVRLVVDTNKQTYTLDADCDSLAEVEERVHEFVEEWRT